MTVRQRRPGARRTRPRVRGRLDCGDDRRGVQPNCLGGARAGTRLRLARHARGFSQQQLAGMAGVSRQAVSAVESGLSDPSLRVALALSRALGLTVEELFGPGDPRASRARAAAGAARPGRRAGVAGAGWRLAGGAAAGRCHRDPGRIRPGRRPGHRHRGRRPAWTAPAHAGGGRMRSAPCRCWSCR